MKISLEKEDLLEYVISQLNTFFPDKREVKKEMLNNCFDKTLDRIEYCFSKVNNKYFKEEAGNVIFNHLNGDQYSMFLYFLSNTLFKNNGEHSICAKIFQLNRYLHGIDVFYEVELPDIFLFVHPLGTVLGRAKYSNYLLVYQGCNVGSNKGLYPVLKEKLCMHPGASILGDCLVEENCKISAGSTLLDKNLQRDTLYVGNPKSFMTRQSLKPAPIWV